MIEFWVRVFALCFLIFVVVPDLLRFHRSRQCKKELAEQRRREWDDGTERQLSLEEAKEYQRISDEQWERAVMKARMLNELPGPEGRE